MDNPKVICLGPRAREKVFLQISLISQTGTLFNVCLQWIGPEIQFIHLGTIWGLRADTEGLEIILVLLAHFSDGKLEARKVK